MENMIEIKNLYKQFGDIQAVNNLSFKVKKGELFAFLGVNGAGKSTTINIICGQSNFFQKYFRSGFSDFCFR